MTDETEGFDQLTKQLSEITDKLKSTNDHAKRAALLKQFRVLLDQAEHSIGNVNFKWEKEPPN